MATIKRFEDLEIWQQSRKLCYKVWKLSLTGSFSKDYALKDQMSKSSGSVMDNIAEGFGRGGNREFIIFLGFASGSTDEVKSQIYRLFDRSHVNEKIFEELLSEAQDLQVKISNFISYLNKSDFRGRKFKGR